MPFASERVLDTERAVERVRPTEKLVEYRIKGARNLILRVNESGRKSWQFLYRAPTKTGLGKRRKVGLGQYPDLKLAEAKVKALDYAAVIRAGFDPNLDEPTDSNTVRDLAALYLAEVKRDHSRTWAANVEHMLGKDILPAIGSMAVDAVTRADVADLVKAVADRGSRRRADQTLSVVRSFYGWALGRGRVGVEIDPTYKLTKHNGNKARKRKLTDAEIKLLWRGMDSQTKLSPQVRDALRLSLLTGARIGECLGVAKSEFNFDEMLWTIPKERTKSDREHVLPLSPWAGQIIRDAMDRTRGVYLFPGRDGKPVRVNSASQAMRRLSEQLGIEDVTSHDLRRTCATRLGGLGTDESIVARVLNHAPKSVTGIHYLHARYVPQMRSALDAWAVELQRILAGDATALAA